MVLSYEEAGTCRGNHHGRTLGLIRIRCLAVWWWSCRTQSLDPKVKGIIGTVGRPAAFMPHKPIFQPPHLRGMPLPRGRPPWRDCTMSGSF